MKIAKKVVEIGNGAAVYVPKEYSGREVVVVIPEGIEEIKKRVLTGLVGFMSNIAGVYLYGSYARNEQEADSDVDVLVITKEKDGKIKEVFKDIDLRTVSLNGVIRSIKDYPLLIMPIFKEAIVMLNPFLLEELKNYKIDIKKFKWSFEEIKRTIKIIENFIELDEEEISPSHIYSLIMRIRVCCLAECLLKNKKFTNNSIRELLLEQGFKKETIDRFFCIYRRIRENEILNIKIRNEEILRLIEFVKDYLKKIENETKKKIGKRN